MGARAELPTSIDGTGSHSLAVADMSMPVALAAIRQA
jgi:hypothetical protein